MAHIQTLTKIHQTPSIIEKFTRCTNIFFMGLVFCFTNEKDDDQHCFMATTRKMNTTFKHKIGAPDTQNNLLKYGTFQNN
jgi:hypothetical protein